jgi:hypothetical protein
VEEGFEAVLSRKQRATPAVPKIFDGEKEASFHRKARAAELTIAPEIIIPERKHNQDCIERHAILLSSGAAMVVEPTVTTLISPLDAKGAVRKQLAPYLIELGLVVVSWNELHDELGQLYYLVKGGPSLGHALEIWHWEKSDRNQRQRIRSELPGALSDLLRVKQEGKEWIRRACEEIEWVLDRADSWADQRNNAIHSPLIGELEANKWKLTQPYFFGHPRAKKLTGKELLSQFKWYWRTFRVLTAYTQHVRLALSIQPPISWPQRPSLPPPPAHP